MPVLQSFAVVCLLFCFAISVTVLGLTAHYVHYIDGPAKNTWKEIRYGSGQSLLNLTPQCVKKDSYYMILASGIGGTVDAFLIIAMLLTKHKYRKESSAKVNMLLYFAVAIISVGRSLAAAAWSWSDYNRYDPFFDPAAAPTAGKMQYPASRGCFTPETYFNHISKYTPGSDSQLRSMTREIEATRALTIPLTILYSFSLIAILVNDIQQKRGYRPHKEPGFAVSG